MKALTICQPYAELIARGDKRVENRTWPTNYRGLLYIHAGKSLEWIDEVGGCDAQYGIRVADMSFGAVMAIATLADCINFEDLYRTNNYSEKYPWLRKHEHTNGPWCWILTDVKRVKPIPWRGALGLWECSAVSEGENDAGIG